MCITHSGTHTLEPGVANMPTDMPGLWPGIPVCE